MDVFDETVQKAKVVFDSAIKKTGELVLVGKQKISVSSLECKLSKAYAELGKLQFKTLKDSDIEDPEVLAVVLEIKQIISDMKRAIDEMNAIDGKPTCPKCKNRAPKGSEFCNKCGSRITK